MKIRIKDKGNYFQENNFLKIILEFPLQLKQLEKGLGFVIYQVTVDFFFFCKKWLEINWCNEYGTPRFATKIIPESGTH